MDHLYWWVEEGGVVYCSGPSILVGGGRGSGKLKWTIYIGGWRKREWCIAVDPLYWWVGEEAAVYCSDHLYWWEEEGGVVY